MATVV
jgi:transposase